jgi:hypothetical protein
MSATVGRGRRLAGWRAAAVWFVALSSIAAIALAQILNPGDWIIVVIIGEVGVSFALVGSILVTRRPDDLVGWLVWGSGSALGWATAATAYATQSGTTCGGCQPGTELIGILANVAFAPIVGTVAIFIPLLFPDGRLPSPRWRPVAWIGLGATALFTAAIAFAPGALPSGIENPIGLDVFSSDGGPGSVAALAAMVVAMVTALASVVWRFRHADLVQRQQLRWFGYATLVMVACIAIGVIWSSDSAWLVLFSGLGVMPLAIGIAILRYRLYDLDRLVSRTISYAVVTGALVLAYLAINLGLSTIFESLTSGNSVAVAASTLVVAALFTPLRRRVQRVVDRRFDRARYDAERTTIAFAERLRDEVDIQAVTGDLGTTVTAAMAPSSLGLWLRAGER